MITMHPGEYLSLSYIEPYAIEPEKLAGRLGVAPGVLADLLAQRTDLSAELALRLELALDRSAQSWLQMQADFNLAAARKNLDPASVQPLDLGAIS